MAYSSEQLMNALRNADAAGDVEAARSIARMIKDGAGETPLPSTYESEDTREEELRSTKETREEESRVNLLSEIQTIIGLDTAPKDQSLNPLQRRKKTLGIEGQSLGIDKKDLHPDLAVSTKADTSGEKLRAIVSAYDEAVAKEGVGMLGQFGRGVANQALLGLPEAQAITEGRTIPQPRTGWEGVSKGAGSLVGFVAGLPLVSARAILSIPSVISVGKALSKALTKTKTPRTREHIEAIGKEAFNLAVMTTAAGTGEALLEKDLSGAIDVYAKSFLSGGLMGGTFAVSKILFPGGVTKWKDLRSITKPEILAPTLKRIALGSLALEVGMSSLSDQELIWNRWQDISAEQAPEEVFHYGMNIFFLLFGKDGKFNEEVMNKAERKGESIEETVQKALPPGEHIPKLLNAGERNQVAGLLEAPKETGERTFEIDKEGTVTVRNDVTNEILSEGGKLVAHPDGTMKWVRGGEELDALAKADVLGRTHERSPVVSQATLNMMEQLRNPKPMLTALPPEGGTSRGRVGRTAREEFPEDAMIVTPEGTAYPPKYVQDITYRKGTIGMPLGKMGKYKGIPRWQDDRVEGKYQVPLVNLKSRPGEYVRERGDMEAQEREELRQRTLQERAEAENLTVQEELEKIRLMEDQEAVKQADAVARKKLYVDSAFSIVEAKKDPTIHELAKDVDTGRTTLRGGIPMDLILKEINENKYLYGASLVAGAEKDEEGNWTWNPQKGLGALGLLRGGKLVGQAKVSLNEQRLKKLTEEKWNHFVQEFIDQFHSVKIHAGKEAWYYTKRTQNSHEMVNGLLKYGLPFWNPDTQMFEIRNKKNKPIHEDPTKENFHGLFHVLKPIEKLGKLDDFSKYITGLQAKIWMKQGRENRFSQKEIDDMLALGKNNEAFKTAVEGLKKINKSVLDLGVATGRLSKRERDLFLNDFHVPFYRIIEEEFMRQRAGKRPANQAPGLKRLMGSEADIKDPIENMVMNWQWIIDSSMKNVAQRKTVGAIKDRNIVEPVEWQWKPGPVNVGNMANALKKHGIKVGKMNKKEEDAYIQLFQREIPIGDNIVPVYRGGKAKYYRIHEPDLFRSLSENMHYADGESMFLQALRIPKYVGTTAVTISPEFRISNMLRDTLSSWVISDTGLVPGVAATKGFVKAWNQNETFLDLMTSGALRHEQFGGAARDPIKALKKFSSEATILDGPAKVWEFWQKVGVASETANRIAIYEGVMKRGGTRNRALGEAQDILDFSQRGQNRTFRHLTDTVLFLNARMQGAYKLGTGAYENPQAFIMKGAMITGATMSLYYMNMNNPKYQELEDWEKDFYYNMFIGDDRFVIPKPFEVGAVFSTIPERMFEYWRGGDETLAVDATIRILSETFAMNPLPQAIKPIAEDYANETFYFGRNIVSHYDLDKPPRFQYKPYTSKSIKLLAQNMPDFAPEALKSPQRLEQLVKGYLASLGGYIVSLSDLAVEKAVGAPPRESLRAMDIPGVKALYKGSNPKTTRYLKEFYDLSREAKGIYRSIKQLREEGNVEGIQQEFERNPRSKYLEHKTIRKYLRQIQQSISAINKQMSAVKGSDMTPQEKRTALDKLIAQRNNIAKYAKTINTDIKKLVEKR